MTTRLRALLLALVLLACCSEEATTRHAPFWRVEHEGRTSILLGTMHVEVDADELPPEIWEELASASVVTTEADMRFVDAAAFRRAVTLPEGESIEASVAPGEWEAIVAAFEGRYEPETLDGLQPWFLEGELVRSMLPETDPIDLTLVARAEDLGIELAFFETWQHQVDLLNGLGLDYGIEVLLGTVFDPEGTLAAHMTWAEAYQQGDIDRLTELAFDPGSMAAAPAYYEEIVFRHDGWLPAIEDQLRRGDALIAAGFMHMLGDRGLVAVLEEAGYEVTVVPP